MYNIEYTLEALKDLKSFRKFEQEHILDQIDAQLQHEPNVETHNRKCLRPNDISDWELRIGKYRVLYDIEEQVKIVAIQAIGFKIGNELYIRGERRKL